MTSPSFPASLHAASAELTAGCLRATDLCAMALNRVAELNPTCHAYWHVAAESALQAAEASDRRRRDGLRIHALDGIPVSVKDSIAVADMPWTGGFAHRRAQIADSDAYVVRRLRKHGAVILGKTALDEASLGTTGKNPHYGDCVHPGFPGYSAGGSSSGAAVSVATGMALYALGTDGMGSARIPAALCGVAGFKPSQGRISLRGVLAGSRRLGCVGVLARHVDDLQLPYHAIAGLDTADAVSRATPLRHLEPDAWRIASLRAEQLPNLADDVALVYGAALERLRTEGGRQDRWTWRHAELDQYDFKAARRDGLLLLSAEMAAVHAGSLRADPETFSPWLRKLLEFPQRRTSVDLMQADLRIDEVVVQMRELFQHHDVLVLPTTPVTAQRLDAPELDGMADFTALASLAGLPALSLPCGVTPQGFPVGLQLVGPVGSDLLLLLLGARWQSLLA